MFTICNTSLAAWLADWSPVTGHLKRSRYWTFGLLPFCYIKCFVHHTFSVAVFCLSLSFRNPAGRSPHVPLLLAFWHPPAILPHFHLQAVLHTHSAISHWLPFVMPSIEYYFIYPRTYAATCSWLITACITTIGILPTFYGIPQVLQRKNYSVIIPKRGPLSLSRRIMNS